MKCIRLCIPISILLLAFPRYTSNAQPFSTQQAGTSAVKSFSSGDGFEVSGAISFVAATSTSDNYVLVAGWLGTSLDRAPLPPLTITVNRQANQITISWPPHISGVVLQEAADPASGDWTLVPSPNASSSPVSISAGDRQKFFRLYKL